MSDRFKIFFGYKLLFFGFIGIVMVVMINMLLIRL